MKDKNKKKRESTTKQLKREIEEYSRLIEEEKNEWGNEANVALIKMYHERIMKNREILEKRKADNKGLILQGIKTGGELVGGALTVGALVYGMNQSLNTEFKGNEIVTSTVGKGVFRSVFDGLKSLFKH